MCRKRNPARAKGIRFKGALALVLAVTLAFVCLGPVWAQDNVTGGDGKVDWALENYAWYAPSHYLWKVSVYAGKSDRSDVTDSLPEAYWYFGSLYMKKTGWEISPHVQFGSVTKIEALAGASLSRTVSPLILSSDRTPAIPIVSGGRLEDVKAFFGTTGTLFTVFRALASENGREAEAWLEEKTFTIGGKTKSGWDASYLMPDGENNRIPWVIVYEPVVEMHLKDGKTVVAFTATEFAMAQKNGWYDWFYSSGRGQAVSKLTHSHLPTSVQLEESWFSLPVFSVSDDTVVWKNEDIVSGGGIGMRFLPPARKVAAVDYAAAFGSVEKPGPSGGSAPAEIVLENAGEVPDFVYAELYRDGTRIYEYRGFLNAGEQRIITVSVDYPPGETVNLIARINFDTRFSETDAENNQARRAVVPRKTELSDTRVESLTAPGSVREGDEIVLEAVFAGEGLSPGETVRAQIRWDGDVVAVKDLSLENGPEILRVTVSGGEGIHTAVAVIGETRAENEANADNNRREAAVTVRRETDLDLPVFTVTPESEEAPGVFSFVLAARNKDRFHEAENVPVTLYAGEKALITLETDLPAGGAKEIRGTLTLPEAGTYVLFARINDPEKIPETDRSNNDSPPRTVTVRESVRIGWRVITPNDMYRRGVTVITSALFSVSGRDIEPSSHVKAEMSVRGPDGRVLYEAAVTDLALPDGESGWVPLTWTVPKDAPDTVVLTMSVGTGGAVWASDTIEAKVADPPDHATPEPRYERQAPENRPSPQAVPGEQTDLTWVIWSYENGRFVREDGRGSLAGECTVTSPQMQDGTLRSGYGLEVTVRGSREGTVSRMTDIQSAEALYPEYGWREGDGVSGTMKKTGGLWTTGTHYIPLWFPDGPYRGWVRLYDVWTPGGMLEAWVPYTLTVSGNLYDDWYVR